MPDTQRGAYLNSLYALDAFLLAGLPASLFVLWLVPGVAVVEATVWVPLAALTLLKLRREHRLREFAGNLMETWTILPFLAFAGLTILWSVDGQVSLARWLVFLATIAVGGYIGLTLDLRRFAGVLAIYCLLILVLSAIFVVFVPSFGIMNYYDIQGAWKGIYWHKNHMGVMAAFANVVFLISGISAFQSGSRSRWWLAALYVLSLLFVARTDSVGSYLTLIVLHGLIVLLVVHAKLRAKMRRGHYAVIGAVAFLAAVVLFANIGAVFGAFNRSSNLTGRVPMWGHLSDIYLSQRPVAGFGFNAFWYVEDHRVTMGQLAVYPDPIVIADNGFIDILVNTGYVGLALFLVFYVDLWIRCIKLAWKAVDITYQFPVLLMAFTLIANLTWTILFENESVFMLAMMSIAVLISSGARIREAAAKKDAATSHADWTPCQGDSRPRNRR